jgi:hypothetical protein
VPHCRGLKKADLVIKDFRLAAGPATALKLSFNRPDLDLTRPGCHGV